MAGGGKSVRTAMREARAAGEKWCFTGVPCYRGHLCRRYTSSGNCFECHTAIDQSSPKYAEYKRQHYLTNTAAYREKGRRWDAENLHKSKEIKARWRRANPEKIRALAVSRSGRAAGRVSASDISEIVERQRHRCACCKKPVKNLEMDHILPVFLGGRTEKGNLQGLCRTCNARKGAKHPIDFNRSVGLLL